jgi:cysteine-rich repeat protein
MLRPASVVAFTLLLGACDSGGPVAFDVDVRRDADGPDVRPDAEIGGGDADWGGDGDGDGRDGDALPVCGNGRLEGVEECDDGNFLAGDGCEPDCTWTCEAPADCDDGDSCNGAEACTDHRCAGGTPLADGTACTTAGGAAGTCRATLCAGAGCGNGRPDPGEECDDMNLDNTDTCLSNCRNARCGDGFVYAGLEECEGPVTTPCTTLCGSAGVQPCISCRWRDCLPPLETCNGVDDDCDESCDEEYACCAGATTHGSEGSCRFTQACAVDCTASVTWDAPPPANDACAAPVTIPAGGTTAPLTGSTCGAGDDYAPPAGCATAAGSGGDVVFTLNLPGTRRVVVDGSGTDFAAAVYVGSSTSGCPGSSVACDSGRDAADPPRLDVILEGGVHSLVLDGNGAARGSYALSVSVTEVPPPTNDTCDTAIDLPVPAGYELQTVTGTTAGATTDVNTCGSWPTTGPDVWYRLSVPAGNHLLYFDLLDGAAWNSRVLVRSLTCDGREVWCADDACGTPRSQWVGTVGLPGTPSVYYLVIDGEDRTHAGPFTLRYGLAGPECTDGAEGRLATSGRYTGGLSESAATAGSCGGAGREAWYYIALCPGRRVMMDTCDLGTDFDSVLYLRRGGCGAGAPEIACNDDSGTCGLASWTSAILFDGEPAGLYFLFIDKDDPDRPSGAWVLDVTGL